MKKLFWIPLFVILMVIPMIAGAAPVAGEPVAGNAGSPTATNTPKYALKGAGAGDEKAALASYVKGAYNAVIKGINNTQDEIDTLNSGIETYSDAIGHLTDGKATKDGTVATIKSATTTESINTSSVNFTGVTTTSISATASGNVNLSVPIMDDWENDSLAATPVQTTANFTNLPVNNLAMSAPTSNTATLTKSGINGTVDVACKIVGNATGSSTQAGTPTPTNPVPIINYQQGDLVLRGVGEYKDTYDATTGTITRNVGVKVLDGTENWVRDTYYPRFKLTLQPDSIVQPNGPRSFPTYCTHFKMLSNGEPIGAVTPNQGYVIRIEAGTESILFLHNNMTDAEQFKQWLADQYAKGTPVTIVYPLATPTTEHYVATCP